MKRYIIATALIASMATLSSAKPILEKNDCAKKLMKMKGEKGPYNHAQKEIFPQGYFLVNSNLPFLVGTALFHPKGDELKLNDKQIEAIMALQKKTVPEAAKAAKKIKDMELRLARESLEEKKDPSSLDSLVDEIAKAKAALTKAHLRCIEEIRQILNEEQFRHLLELARAKK